VEDLLANRSPRREPVEVEVHVIAPYLTMTRPEMRAKSPSRAGGAQRLKTPLMLVPRRAVVEDGNQ
jgi:hypothetical protein